MQDLLQSYTKTRRTLRAIRTLNTDQEERKVIGSMVSDCEFVVRWLKTGRRPGNRRGIERLAAYQREKVVDPLLMQRYYQSVGGDPYKMIDAPKTNLISDTDRERLEDAMCELTDIEREYYLLARGQCFSYEEIAKMFKVTKSTVQTTVERAENKIAKRVNESLFCFVG